MRNTALRRSPPRFSARILTFFGQKHDGFRRKSCQFTAWNVTLKYMKRDTSYYQVSPLVWQTNRAQSRKTHNRLNNCTLHRIKIPAIFRIFSRKFSCKRFYRRKNSVSFQFAYSPRPRPEAYCKCEHTGETICQLMPIILNLSQK